MASARPLRDVFADLTGAPGADDPAALLRDHGHPGLPDELVAEAVVSYADTAPVEVAEHLAPYVTAHSVVGADPATGNENPDWLDLLGTAPAGDPADLDGLPQAPEGFDDDGLDLGFGQGAGPAEPVGLGTEDEDHAGEPVEILPDPAGLDEHGDLSDWAPGEQAADPAADGFDDAEPDGDALG
jgi:hypothetical protein